MAPTLAAQGLMESGSGAGTPGMHIEAFFKCDKLGTASTMKSMEKYSKILGFKFGTISPRDAATGLASGKRTHQPVVLWKQLDISTPAIFQALCQNQTLDSVEIMYYQAHGTEAKRVQFFKLTLTNATIVESEVLGGFDGNKVIERIAFTFQKIEYNEVPDSKTSQDSWDEQV